MPRRRQGSVPSLQHHKASGRARVWIKSRDYWLGKWGSPEAQLAYNRLIGEYLATGRIESTRPEPVAKSVVEPVTEVVVSPSRSTIARHAPPADEVRTPGALTVIELVSLYLEYCQTYYRDPSGRQTSTYGNALQASRALRPFDDTLASSFGPKRLGMIRDSEAAAGRPRVGCNAILKHVRRVFQWAESQELVPRGTYNSLKTVEPLKKGRTVAPELPPVKPIDEEIVEATLPYLAEVVADMIRFQRLTGSRPGEVCGLRPAAVQSSRSISSMKILVRAATALGRSARKQRNRFGTEITHCRTGTGGMTWSTRCAAVCAIRRPLQEGQTPRPLHEKATTKPCPHDVQRARPNPKQRMPQVRYDRSSRSTYAGTGCSATARVSSQPSRCSATTL
jgi:hypothetical protein